MTLNYTWGGDDYHDGTEYEYDIDYSQIDEYFKQLPKEELIKCLEEAYQFMKEKDKAEVLNDLLEDPKRNLIKKMNGTNPVFEPNFKNLLEDDFDWCVEIFLYDNLDEYKEDMEDYFEDDAYESYKDGLDWEEEQKDLERWYYSTRGV